jgi:integrase
MAKRVREPLSELEMSVRSLPGAGEMPPIDLAAPEERVRAAIDCAIARGVWWSLKDKTRSDYSGMLRHFDEWAEKECPERTQRDQFVIRCEQHLRRAAHGGPGAGSTMRKLYAAIRKWEAANQIADSWTDEVWVHEYLRGIDMRGGHDLEVRAVKPRAAYSRAQLAQMQAVAMETNELDIAVGLRLLFDTGCRRKHLARLKVRDFYLAPGTGTWVARMLDHKTAKQSVHGYECNVHSSVALFVKHGRATKPDDKAFPKWSANKALKIVRNTAERWKWSPDYEYDLHCFRYAFAAELKERGVSIDDIRRRGNWAKGSHAVLKYCGVTGKFEKFELEVVWNDSSSDDSDVDA